MVYFYACHFLNGRPYRHSLKPHRIWRHKLLPVGIYWSLKNGWRCCIRRFGAEFLKNGLREDHEILRTHRGQSAPQNCQIWHHQLLLVSYKMLLNTAQMCIKRVRSAKSRITRPLFNIQLITKFYTDINADHIGYGVINYFWLAFLEIRKNGRECRLRRPSVEF